MSILSPTEEEPESKSLKKADLDIRLVIFYTQFQKVFPFFVIKPTLWIAPFVTTDEVSLQANIFRK